jgi:hypothetical protein
MYKTPEAVRELRPHALWTGAEWAWRLVEATVIASLLAFIQFLRSHLDLVSIGAIFVGSLVVLVLGA